MEDIPALCALACCCAPDPWAKVTDQADMQAALERLQRSIEDMRTDCNSTAAQIVGVVEGLTGRVVQVGGGHFVCFNLVL